MHHFLYYYSVVLVFFKNNKTQINVVISTFSFDKDNTAQYYIKYVHNTQFIIYYDSDVDRVEILLVMVGEEEKFLEERGGQVSSDHNSPPSSTYGVSTALANGTTSSVHLSYRECSNQGDKILFYEKQTTIDCWYT